jgi:DNA repair protein RadC
MKEFYDKLYARGPQALSDEELLVILLGEGNEATTTRQLVKELLAHYNYHLTDIGHDTLSHLRMVSGIGQRRASRIVAATELGRRMLLAQGSETTTILSSDDVVRIFRPEMELLTHEECWAIYLSSANHIIERQRISQGGVQGTVVDSRIIIKRALELLATQLILVHNHPSGSAEASEQDRVLTTRIAQAAELFDIRLIDHIIVARDKSLSFRAEGLL